MRPWLVGAALTAGLVASGVAGWQRWMSLSLPPVPSPSRIQAPARCSDEGGRIQVEWMGRPPTWKATIADVDLIVVAKRLPDRPDVEERQRCLFTTYYSFTVLEVVKGQVGVGDRLKVGWLGRPIDVVEDLPAPEPDEILVLFLKAQSGNYYPAYGPGGILRVVEGIVAPYSSVYRLSDVLGRPVDHFTDMLRGFANGK